MSGAVESAAGAVVNGDTDSGRRRMTLAHELGHWLCGDAYDVWARDDRERMLNSFAIHFLAPRAGWHGCGTPTAIGAIGTGHW